MRDAPAELHAAALEAILTVAGRHSAAFTGSFAGRWACPEGMGRAAPAAPCSAEPHGSALTGQLLPAAKNQHACAVPALAPNEAGEQWKAAPSPAALPLTGPLCCCACWATWTLELVGRPPSCWECSSRPWRQHRCGAGRAMTGEGPCFSRRLLTCVGLALAHLLLGCHWDCCGAPWCWSLHVSARLQHAPLTLSAGSTAGGRAAGHAEPRGGQEASV